MARRTARAPRISAAARPGSKAAPDAASVPPLVPEAILTMNTGGTIQSASDSIERVFGWTPRELFGQNVGVLIPEPRRSSLDKYLDRYRRGDTAKTLHRARRFDAVRKDGSPVQIELSVSRADLPARESPYFIGIIRDVSNEIDASGDLPADRAKQLSLITEQTRALATAHLRLQLSDRLASLGALAAGLGHDMSNVLLPIRARLNALEREAISPAGVNHVRAMRKSIAYLQQLSDGLHFLALDPDGADTITNCAGGTNLASWWKQVGPLLRKSVPGHVRVWASLPEGLPEVKIAPQWLTQAMLNLILNAGEALADRPRAAAVRIAAEASDDRATVRLTVSDNGAGMRPDEARHAFDLFFTTKSRTMGTGLGLPLVRKVAALAGGTVELNTRLGRGTTVTMVLPSIPSDVGATETGSTSSPTAFVTVKAPRIAAFISQTLLGLGFHVRRSARNGQGAANLWVTEPTPAALAAARKWSRAHDERTLVLVGAPPKSDLARWNALHPVIIDPSDDLEAIRFTVARAFESAQRTAKSSEAQR
ncbi:MAG TPA: ATP-binding protein [Phycisphaerales bacterium]|nr:ATP-binding protein [Phycisphaerales bacterium]